MQRENSVHAEDYAALFAASALTCTPVVEGAAPETDAAGSLTRVDVSVAITFPDDAAHADALAHFLPRATAAGAFLTFDHVIHLENPSFAAGSACATLLPFENSVYAIDAATAAPGKLALTLTPASTKDTHLHMDVTLKWDPIASREVARRAAAGEPAGVDARRRLRGRELATIASTTAKS